MDRRSKYTDNIQAAREYLKMAFVDRDFLKADIALRIALSMSDDSTEDVFSKAVCERFRDLDDYDPELMDKIFDFSICNDRVLTLLDNVMISKTVQDDKAIDHELHIEFIFLFFNGLLSLVRRGFVDEGTAKSCQMEDAWKIVNAHASAIANKCWPCFDLKAFKRPRSPSNLVAEDGALPHHSIGCEPVNFDELTVDMWEGSLREKKEKYEFMEIIFAAISHVSSAPLMTFLDLRQASVKTFFLETMLDEVQADRVRSVSNVVKVPRVCKQLDRYESRYRSLVESFVSLDEKCWSVEKKHVSLEAKHALLDAKYSSLLQEHREQGTELSYLKEVIVDAKHRLDRKRVVVEEADGIETGRSAKAGRVEK